MSAPFRVDISQAPLTFAKSVAKITGLVTEETKSFHGQTVQKVIEQDEDVAVSQMCQQQGGCDPTVVRHSRTPPRLIPGAIPGVNCGIGTDGSCCCANDALASNTPTPASPLIAQPHSPVMTDGVYRIGNGVSSPILPSSVNAEFTDQAHRAKYQGVCTLSVVIDLQGNPQNPHIVHGPDMGLNEKAIEAVMKWRFKPAMKDGQTPVPVMISVNINFNLY